jgi:serine phosphatase RsbU (regulator of sigma subunit)
VPLTGRSGTFGAITMLYSDSGRRYSEADVPFAEDVARRAALALETADRFRTQSGQLRTVTRIAEAAQRAILAPPPSRVGNVDLAARYVSAAAEAQVGGDFYEVVRRPDAVRLLIGDVRGKGLAAVRTATIVLGEFRAATAVEDLNDAARQMDQGVRPYLGDEDFITALIVEIANDGSYVMASCGHPPPLLASAAGLNLVDLQHGLPLGLGADPDVHSGQLHPGDRFLLYTDGVIEARDPQRQFVNLLGVSQAVLKDDLDEVLTNVLDALHAAVGSELGDDVALMVAQYCPREAQTA